MSKIYEQGASGLVVGAIGADGTFGTSSKAIEGLIELSLDISEELTKIPADNNPAFATFKSPAIGSGELKITAIPLHDYALLTSAIQGSSNVIAFGEDVPVTYHGFSFKKIYVADGVQSTNLIMAHRCVFGFPTEGSVTKDEAGNTITECTIPFEVYPAYYTDGSETRCRTLTKLNSAVHAALYATLKDKCFAPSEALLGGCVVTFTKTPVTATVVVKFGSTVVPPQSDGTYKLTAGSYTYDASASGYTGTAGTSLVIAAEDITAGAKAVTVTLTEAT